MRAQDAARVKHASAAADIHELVAARWSGRAFDTRPIDPGVLRQLFEAARWAPSSANEQPWRFVLADRADAPAFAAVLACLTAANQRWAHAAAAFVVTAVKVTLTRGGGVNHYAWHDLGLAVATLSIQATALNLGVHQMAGVDLGAVRQAVGMPTDFDPVTVLALGYHGDPAGLAEQDRVRELTPRSRHAVDEFVFRGRWNQGLVQEA